MAKQIIIDKGADADVRYHITNPDSTEFDLTGLTGATGFFKNADGTTLAVSGTAVSEVCGLINVSIGRDDVDLLEEGDALNTEIRFDIGPKRYSVRFEGQLVVNAKLF